VVGARAATPALKDCLNHGIYEGDRPALECTAVRAQSVTVLAGDQAVNVTSTRRASAIHSATGCAPVYLVNGARTASKAAVRPARPVTARALAGKPAGRRLLEGKRERRAARTVMPVEPDLDALRLARPAPDRRDADNTIGTGQPGTGQFPRCGPWDSWPCPEAASPGPLGRPAATRGSSRTVTPALVRRSGIGVAW
jgi:hypothetical protein